jgi:Fe-S oxidoreductase
MSDAPITTAGREGSLEAPTRHPVPWRDAEFYDEESLFRELERVYDICHGCRRCFNLCNAFPVLFDAIDESSTGELNGVDRKAYWEVVDHCYLCDMCYMTKCPYVPPHPWNVDFPHLMLRAKALRFRKEGAALRDRVLSATDRVGSLAGIPVVAQIVNAVNASNAGRKLLDKTLGVHPTAPVPRFHSRTGRQRVQGGRETSVEAVPTPETRGRVVLFATCYCNRNEPDLAEDLAVVMRHNGIEVTLAAREKCCGMPKFELGDLESIDRSMRVNVPELARWVDQGWDIVAPIPSCVLMFKQELPLLYPDDPQVAKVGEAMFDPFEYLMLRHRAGRLRTDFTRELGKVSYHVACHLRVQNLGLKTRDVLQLVPNTQVEPIERCSGHNGTYGVKTKYRDISMKIGRPVVSRVANSAADFYASDCPMAARQIESGLEPVGGRVAEPTHPLKLLRLAYGI